MPKLRTVIEWDTDGMSTDPKDIAQFKADLATYLQSIGIDAQTELWLTEGFNDAQSYSVTASCTGIEQV